MLAHIPSQCVQQFLARLVGMPQSSVFSLTTERLWFRLNRLTFKNTCTLSVGRWPRNLAVALHSKASARFPFAPFAFAYYSYVFARIRTHSHGLIRIIPTTDLGFFSLWVWRNTGTGEVIDGNRQSFVIVRNRW